MRESRVYKIKCRVLNQYGIPENISGASQILVEFPYENSETLSKSMANKHVKILDATKGEIEVSLSDFEVQGIPASEKQTFHVKIKVLGKIKTYRFNEALSIAVEDSRKVIK